MRDVHTRSTSDECSEASQRILWKPNGEFNNSAAALDGAADETRDGLRDAARARVRVAHTRQLEPCRVERNIAVLRTRDKDDMAERRNTTHAKRFEIGL